jgi:hypothetical protein
VLPSDTNGLWLFNLKSEDGYINMFVVEGEDDEGNTHSLELYFQGDTEMQPHDYHTDERDRVLRTEWTFGDGPEALGEVLGNLPPEAADLLLPPDPEQAP